MRRVVLMTLIALLFFGGWGLIRAVAAPGGDCDVCGRIVHEGASARLTLPSGEAMDLCCSRCALIYQRSHGFEAAPLSFSDSAGAGMVAVDEAVFVEGGKSPSCCAPAAVRRDGRGSVAVASWDRCRPSLRAFADRRRAEEYARRHGGVVVAWRQLRPGELIN